MLDKDICGMVQQTGGQDPEFLALVRATRDYLVYVLRWLERRYRLVK